MDRRLPLSARTTVAIAAVAAGSLAALAGTGQAAVARQGMPHTAHAAGGTSSSLLEVTVAPKSSDAWAVTSTIRTAPFKQTNTVSHLHNGHWAKLAVQGRKNQTTSLRDIAAGSPKQIWAVGGTLSQANVDTPVLEKSTGGAFKIVNLKGLGNSSHLPVVAASSTKNAWALGEADDGLSSYTLHWNGKKWAQKTLTINGAPFASAALATSASNNVWALGSVSGSSVVIHWNGRKWAVSLTVPAGETLSDIATSGSHTFAVGTLSSQSGEASLALTLSGSKWKMIKLAHAAGSLLEGVSAVGKTAYAVGFTENITGKSQHPVYAKLTGTKGKIGVIKKESTFSATFSVAASTKAAVAVGSYERTQCTSPTHPLAEVLSHGAWKLSAVPSKVAPATKTGQGICG